MLSIAKRTLIGAAILLVMPVGVLISGWRWSPDHNALFSPWLKVMYWATETVTEPWGIITHLMLWGWFLWCLRFRLRAALTLLLILAAVILAGQGAKSWIKNQVQAPRPYVIWLEKNHHIPVAQFYGLKSKQRGELVNQQLADQPAIPGWLRHHWEHETGFSFPSGHTMFAATWALLAIGLLWPRRRTVTIVLITLWAMMVMGSRLVLGMHWPRDLIRATILSWVLVTLGCWLAQRLCGPLTPPPQEEQEIAERSGEPHN
ncbi:phosphatidylglycerophosphatase B [Shimwellia pseudoproteus]|uniref:phosphatidylglycerophosphatase B n=1 Tax=Shimwellia pseudoproteus TaxID=570012 RepID=UPI0018EB495C|nr:phosphatidylglycerophosphatase B [Shimwellia pseudoproteus]MBJ3813593.1 phosphatidylglycerophosphatase B [Shimwellia pseudoproteus]